MIFVNNSIIKGVEPETIHLIPFQGGGGGLNGPVDLEEGGGQGREPIDAIAVGVKREVELPVAPEVGDGFAVYFRWVLYRSDHAFGAIARGKVQPLGKMRGSRQEGGDVEGKPIALAVVVFQHALWQVTAELRGIILREDGLVVGVLEADALLVP